MFGIPNIGIPVSVRHIAPPDPKKARTVYVGGVTGDVTERVLRDFFEHRIPQVPNRPPSQGRIIDNVQINSEKMYAFVEFFNFVDADIAMCFDGVKLGQQQIRIRRPTNYTPPVGQQTWSISGVLSTQVPDGPNKIFLGNLPTTMTDVEVQMLASAFGELQAFTLITDRATGVSKGYAFMCYKDASVTNAACAGLNGQELGGKRLACKTANQKSAMDAVAMLNGLGGGNPFAGFGLDATPMLVMENMVTPQELEDPEEFEDILLDIEQECRKHGNLLKVVIPRVQDVTTDYSRLIAADVGKIFVKYHDVDSALVARSALNGRKFNDRTIVINFITQEDWERKGLN
jgi:splicing factor U2AF subunit